MSARVSVALCTHNGERFLGEQLASILAQSVRPDELVVSDDASADGTIAVAERLTADSGIATRILRNEPALGVTANFQGAVTTTSGDLIALSDQDDVWQRDRLAAALARFDRDDEILLVHSDARLVDATGAPTGGTLFDWLEVSAADLAAEQGPDGFAVLLRRNLATGATVVFRRRLLDLALPFPPEWVHDEWLAVFAAVFGRIGVVPGLPVDYRQHGSNEIGVAAPTLRHKVSRVLGTDGERNRLLAAKFRVLAERLAELGAPPSAVLLAEQKAEFERARAELPRARLRRVPGVLRLWRAGLYERFASRQRFDVVRDLLRRP